MENLVCGIFYSRTYNSSKLSKLYDVDSIQESPGGLQYEFISSDVDINIFISEIRSVLRRLSCQFYWYTTHTKIYFEFS